MGQWYSNNCFQPSFDNKILLLMSKKNDYIHLSIEPPKEGDRVPSDIVCILDSSGSMSCEATVKNSEGIKESQGYTLLDILKHAVKTVIENLSDNDRFSLINFESQAYEQYSLNFMNQKEKIKANEALEKLEAQGGTNLWDGLLKGSQILRNSNKPNRQKVIILLTDGEPNQNPKIGIVKTFKNYLKKTQFKYTVHTLALGKQMNSALLTKLALLGQGQFSFIPCAGFMGTIFVNTLSNILCTCAANAVVSLEGKNGTKIVEVVGYEDWKSTKMIELGDIKYGQSQDLIIKIANNNKGIEDANEFIDAKLYYNDFEQTKMNCSLGQNSEATPMFDYHLCRLTLIESIRTALNIGINELNSLLKTKEYITKVEKLIEETIKCQEQQLEEIDLDQQESHPISSSLQYLKNIEQDIKGEITLAFCKSEWFNQWGQHYLPSLLMCHQKQTCNNFKDPGIKLYGGELFKKIKQKIEDTFLSLPPPKPPKFHHPSPVNTVLNKRQQRRQSPPKQDFSVYYDAGGGCFASWSEIVLADQKVVKICDVQKGDLVLTRNLKNQLSSAKIKAVVEIQLEKNKAIPLVLINQAIAVTAKHPIWSNNEWKKPYQIQQPMLIENVQALYNLVLENDHQIFVGGIWCVTLGHQIQGKNTFHGYFATGKVVEDLRQINGWEEGRVVVENKWFVRREGNGAVCGMKVVN